MQSDLNLRSNKAASSFQLSQPELDRLVAVVTLAKDYYNLFDPVVLDVAFERVQAIALTLEKDVHISNGNAVLTLARNDITDIGAMLLSIGTDYSRFAPYLAQFLPEQIDELEEKLADLPLK